MKGYKMNITFKRCTVFTFDIFFNDGWSDCARFRVFKGEIIPYKRFGRTPTNYVQLAEDAYKSSLLASV
jgi:hypothetical protein